MIIIQFATAKYWNCVFKNIGDNIDKRFDIDLSTATYKTRISFSTAQPAISIITIQAE